MVGTGWETVSGDSFNLKEYLLENVASIRKDCFIRKIEREVYDPDGINSRADKSQCGRAITKRL
jgi:hypothetical protein